MKPPKISKHLKSKNMFCIGGSEKQLKDRYAHSQGFKTLQLQECATTRMVILRWKHWPINCLLLNTKWKHLCKVWKSSEQQLSWQGIVQEKVMANHFFFLKTSPNLDQNWEAKMKSMLVGNMTKSLKKDYLNKKKFSLGSSGKSSKKKEGEKKSKNEVNQVEGSASGIINDESSCKVLVWHFVKTGFLIVVQPTACIHILWLFNGMIWEFENVPQVSHLKKRLISVPS